jgi:prevent-host-death family protein
MRVGIRELSHHTSQYLSRVKHGEVLEVTEHGRVIATINPSGEDASAPDATRPRPRPGGGQSGDPAAARRVDEFLARGFGER